MKSFIVLAICLAVAVAAPADKDAVILRSELYNIGVDGFDYGYETSNGINAAAKATLEDVAIENGGIIPGLVVRGEFSYVGPDNVLYKVQYIADKDGFRPIGEHIPA